MFAITGIRHMCAEKAGFCLKRPDGLEEYTFLHFHTCVEININGETIKTEPHACILFSPGTPQYISSETPLMHDWFHFVVEGPIPNFFKCNKIYYPFQVKTIGEIVQTMENEYRAKAQNYEHLLFFKLMELLIQVARENSSNVDCVEKPLRDLFREIRTKMLWESKKKWSVPEMAAMANLSVSRFSAVYRSLYGKPPIEDMLCAKIDVAKSYLRTSNFPISKIADIVGFEDVAHFSKFFKNRVGISPSAYREKHHHSQDGEDKNLLNIAKGVHP